MFNTTGTGYTLADIAAVSGNNKSNGFFGDDGWWIILLFLFAGGGWGNGFGFGGNRGGEIAYGFDFNGLENGIKGIQQGLCDGFYAINTGMLTGFNGVQSTLCQGFSGVNSSVNALGTQMAQCCCDLRYENAKNFADLGYALATQSCDTRRAIADSTRDLIENNNAGVKSILDFLTQDKIATLTAENQSLKFAASQAAQNAFITANQEAQTAELIRKLGRDNPVPAYVVPNPNCCYAANTCSICG